MPPRHLCPAIVARKYRISPFRSFAQPSPHLSNVVVLHARVCLARSQAHTRAHGHRGGVKPVLSCCVPKRPQVLAEPINGFPSWANGPISARKHLHPEQDMAARATRYAAKKGVGTAYTDMAGCEEAEGESNMCES